MAGILFGGSHRTNAHTPPAATSLRVLTSNNGMALPLVYGTARVAGNLIWYGDFVATPHNQGGGGGGGKGGGGGGGGGTTTYTYSASVAIGMCEGPIGGIGRIWRGKKIIDGNATSIVHVPTTITESYVVPASGVVTVNHAARYLSDMGVTLNGVPVPVDGGGGEGGNFGHDGGGGEGLGGGGGGD